MKYFVISIALISFGLINRTTKTQYHQLIDPQKESNRLELISCANRPNATDQQLSIQRDVSLGLGVLTAIGSGAGCFVGLWAAGAAAITAIPSAACICCFLSLPCTCYATRCAMELNRRHYQKVARDSCCRPMNREEEDL